MLASQPVVSYHTQRDSTRRRATTLMLYRPSARFDSDLAARSVYVSNLTTVKTPETALGNNNSAQTSTQKFLDLGRSSLSIPSGRARGRFRTEQPGGGACQLLGSRPRQPKLARTRQTETRTWLLGHSFARFVRPLWSQGTARPE